MDVEDLTCEQTEADSSFLSNEENVVLLDMSDVCCEVDVGDGMTTSNDELKFDMGSSGTGSMGRCISQATSHVEFLSSAGYSFDDIWDDNLLDEYPDSETDSQNNCLSCVFRARNIMKDSSTQTDDNTALMSVEDFKSKPDIILFHTGLKSYDKFMHIFHTLEPECYGLKYRFDEAETLNIRDQLFLTLMKLRTNKDDFELSLFFGISLKSVTNIFETWILFLYKTWMQLDLWLPRNLIDTSMPSKFKNMFPTVRVIIDCFDLPIPKPVDDTAQVATFNSNTNEHNLKILVGFTPSGLVSFCSEAYGGATSVSKMFELSGILNKLEPNDFIIIDERFDVKETCASKQVTVHAVNLKENSGSRFSLLTGTNNNQSYPFISLEHLVKRNRILEEKLNINLVHLASEICFVCIVMSNFCDADVVT